FSGQMQQPRPALEHLEFAIAQERDLTEGLTRRMVGPAVVDGNGSHRIAEPGFLARPSQPYVPHETARPFGHPVIGPDDQFAHAFLTMRAFLGLRGQAPPSELIPPD